MERLGRSWGVLEVLSDVLFGTMFAGWAATWPLTGAKKAKQAWYLASTVNGCSDDGSVRIGAPTNLSWKVECQSLPSHSSFFLSWAFPYAAPVAKKSEKRNESQDDRVRMSGRSFGCCITLNRSSGYGSDRSCFVHQAECSLAWCYFPLLLRVQRDMIFFSSWSRYMYSFGNQINNKASLA